MIPFSLVNHQIQPIWFQEKLQCVPVCFWHISTWENRMNPRRCCDIQKLLVNQRKVLLLLNKSDCWQVSKWTEPKYLLQGNKITLSSITGEVGWADLALREIEGVYAVTMKTCHPRLAESTLQCTARGQNAQFCSGFQLRRQPLKYVCMHLEMVREVIMSAVTRWLLLFVSVFTFPAKVKLQVCHYFLSHKLNRWEEEVKKCSRFVMLHKGDRRRLESLS